MRWPELEPRLLGRGNQRMITTLIALLIGLAFLALVMGLAARALRGGTK
jgi:hypothetical protein